jgi:hypothetical protein
MKCKLSNQSCKALTLVEVLVVIVVLVILVNLWLSSTTKRLGLAGRVSCVYNLQRIYTARALWSGNHNDLYPIQVPARDGGTLEFANSPEIFRHFLVLSNELGLSPKTLMCPNDNQRKAAGDFSHGFNNSNLSYFLGLDLVDTNTAMFLTGDRNLSDTDEMQHGLVAWSTNRTVKWTKDIHNEEGARGGNILLDDGSVQQVSNEGLQLFWQNTGVPTNRLALP